MGSSGRRWETSGFVLWLCLALHLSRALGLGADGAESGNSGGRPESIAVCFIGRLRALELTLEPMRKHLLAPLRAGNHQVELLLYAPSPTETEVARLAPLFAEPGLVQAVRFDDEAGLLERLAAERAPELRRAMRIRGNWLGSARRELLPGSRDRRAGTGLFQMHAQLQCLEMVEARERRRGAAYGRVVVTRTDLRWLFPHPPLELLARHLVWVPDTGEDDWGGLYDRHLVLPRSAAAAALGGWRLLVSGRARDLIVGTVGAGALRGNSTNTEVWLAIRLLAAGHRIARFPMTAYIACDPSEWAVASSAAVPGDTGRGVEHGDVQLVPTNIHGPMHGFRCQRGHDHRYPLEHKAVVEVSTCLAHGSVPAKVAWSHSSAKSCYCDIYSPDEVARDLDRWAICRA